MGQVPDVAASTLVWFGGTLGTGWYAPALAAAGAALLFLAWMARNDQDEPKVARPIAILSVAAAGVWAILLSSGANAIQLHQTARDTPAIAILTFALASGLGMLRSRAARTIAVPLALAGAAAVMLASRAYLEQFGSDPFLASADPLAVEIEDGPLIAETRIPDRPAELRVSPGGRSVAFAYYSSEESRTYYKLGRDFRSVHDTARRQPALRGR